MFSLLAKVTLKEKSFYICLYMLLLLIINARARARDEVIIAYKFEIVNNLEEVFSQKMCING